MSDPKNPQLAMAVRNARNLSADAEFMKESAQDLGILENEEIEKTELPADEKGNVSDSTFLAEADKDMGKLGKMTREGHVDYTRSIFPWHKTVQLSFADPNNIQAAKDWIEKDGEWVVNEDFMKDQNSWNFAVARKEDVDEARDKGMMPKWFVVNPEGIDIQDILAGGPDAIRGAMIAGGTVVGNVPGAGAGAAAGEMLNQKIGNQMGVREGFDAGKQTEEALLAAGGEAVAPGVNKLVGTVTGPAKKALEKAGDKFLSWWGKTLNVSKPNLNRLKTNPNEIFKKADQIKEDEVGIAWSEANENLNRMAIGFNNRVSKGWKSVFNGIKNKYGSQKFDISDAKVTYENIDGESVTEGIFDPLEKFIESKTVKTTAKNAAKRFLKEWKSASEGTGVSVEELQSLKKEFDDVLWAKGEFANIASKDVPFYNSYKALQNFMSEQIPELKDLNSTYAPLFKLKKWAVKKLGSENPNASKTMARNMDNYKEVREDLQRIGEEIGEDINNMLGVAKSSEMVAELGGRQSVSKTGFASSKAIGGGFFGLAIASLSGSPSLMGAALGIGGLGGQIIENPNMFFRAIKTVNLFKNKPIVNSMIEKFSESGFTSQALAQAYNKNPEFKKWMDENSDDLMNVLKENLVPKTEAEQDNTAIR